MNGNSPVRPTYKWWVVFMLWFVCFLNYADRQAITAVFPKLREEFQFSETELGLIGSAFMWVYAAGAPLAGFIGDRVRRKDLILGGCIFWSAVTVATGWCGKLWHFITVRALEGFGETFYFPASMSLTSDYHDSRTRSRAMSWHQSSVYLGTIAGSWWGAWFAEQYNWRFGFYFFGSAGIVLALALYCFLREPRRGEADLATLSVEPLAEEASLISEAPPFCEVVRHIGKTPSAMLLMFAFVAANFVATIFLIWTPTFLVDKFHYKLTTAGLSGTVFIHLASAVSVPWGGWLADVLSRRGSGGRVKVQLLGLACGAGFVSLVGMTDSKNTLLLAMTGFGLCKGLYDSNIFAALYDVMPARSRSTAAGLMNTVGWAGGALGPVYAGWFADHGPHRDKIANLSLAITLSGAAYVLGAVLLALAILSLKSRSSSSEPN